jgi:predicted ATP-grasp superfamily ATP-dependent carboligase
MADRVRSLPELCTAVAERSFDRPPALVCNAHVTGLGVARALDEHGVPVITIDRSDEGVAPYSSAVDLAGRVTYPLDDPERFRTDVERIIAELEHEPIGFACMDEWVHAMAETHPDGLRLPFAAEAIETVLNKESLYESAEHLDVPYPETYRLEGVGGESILDANATLTALDPDEAARTLGFPLVLKPARKRAFEEVVGTNVLEVEDHETYTEILATADDAGVRVMAQEKVSVEPGADRSLASYQPPEGEPVAIVGNARARYPQGYGTSCVVDRVEDPEIHERGRALLADAGYHGISEAEFVRDRDREEYVLLDVNTRPWKWIGLPVAAGANLPYAAYAETVGLEYEQDQPRDTRWVFLADYLARLQEGSEAVLTPAERRSLIAGDFEAEDSLTTGVYRLTDPDPTQQLLETMFSTREYYCAC